MLSSRRLASQSCLTPAISPPSCSDLRSRSAASRSSRSCCSSWASLIVAVLPVRLVLRTPPLGELLAEVGVLLRPPRVRAFLLGQLGFPGLRALVALARDLGDVQLLGLGIRHPPDRLPQADVAGGAAAVRSVRAL